MTTLGDSPTLGATGGTGRDATASAGGSRDPIEGQVGRFRLLDKLGEGGMGVVYAAHDDQLDRKVALKFLTKSGSSYERLEREARSLARLAHPNVVAVYEVGESAGKPYLAMEYVPGRTLRGWILDDEGRTRLEILRMFASVGRGLAAAHEVGVIHRDFKPDNVIVGLDGRPRVLDFGLARVGGSIAAEPKAPLQPGVQPGAIDPSLTATGAVMGTPAYMAPEQWAGSHADARTDQFAFCVALFEALYGRSPFTGATAMELMECVLDAEPVEIPTTERVPASLHAAILRGLAKDAEHRWPGMPPLLDLIEEALTRSQPGVFGGRPVVMVGIIAMMATAFFLLPALWLVLELTGVIGYAARNWLYISGGQFLLLLSVLLSQRRHIVRQLSDPRLIIGPMLVATFMLGHRAIALVTGTSIEVVFAYDFLAVAAFAGVMVYLIERALWPVLVMNVTLTIVATLRPEWGPRLWLVFTLGLPSLALGSILRSRHRLRDGLGTTRSSSRPPSRPPSAR